MFRYLNPNTQYFFKEMNGNTITKELLYVYVLPKTNEVLYIFVYLSKNFLFVQLLKRV